MLKDKLNELINEGMKVRTFNYQEGDYGSWISGIEYEAWISKCIIFLNSNFLSNELTIKFKQAADNAVGNGLSYFDTMIGVLTALKDCEQVLVPQQQANVHKIPKLFVSHANLDSKYCNALVDLIIDIGIKREDIFYSSFDETGVTLGEDFLDFIRNEFTTDKNVYVLFMLSNNFYESKVCLAEMGASWVKAYDYLPILIPPTSFEDIKGVIKPSKNSMKINDSSKLEALKEKLENMFNIEKKIPSQAWIRKKDEYLNKINSLINENTKDNLEVIVEKVIDFFGKKNSRLKIKLANNCKKAIRPTEFEFEIKDINGNIIKEMIDDERITEVVVNPFEKIIVYVDLNNINTDFRKARIDSTHVSTTYEYLG